MNKIWHFIQKILSLVIALHRQVQVGKKVVESTRKTESDVGGKHEDKNESKGV